MFKQPLADRIRPESFEDMVGDPKLFGAGGIFPQMLKVGHIPNMIFFGPSGTGENDGCQYFGKSRGENAAQAECHKRGTCGSESGDFRELVFARL